MKRSVCIHGHFYQPPRENPWTGSVERQTSAGRAHDWNARIARECYVPNSEARVIDGTSRIMDLVDNYEWISFDFGPTLLAWYEKAHPHAYALLLEADRSSAARLEGHGNAIAQSFHHTILPLSDPRDRVTEILWGLADFEHRFKRKAEGMWLPECGADEATLAAVAAAGVKFVILEPHQADGKVTCGEPYRWKGSGGESLAVFFYDAELSRSVAFERAMSDSRAFARRLSPKPPPAADSGLALIATDGETYGHHDQFAEMGLAHLVRYALPEADMAPVNLGWYLARNPPRQDVRLKPGGTSWSCAHGVERWKSDCGCGAVEGRHQRWRAPLRKAAEDLRGKLAALYAEKSRGLLTDPWAARDAYIAVVLDRSEESIGRFLAAHAPGAKSEAERIAALRLLEMQRHSLMMFTSCGWFFDEISRLEPVQILLYAARALELARGFGADLEPEFVAALAQAPSNEPQFGDGSGVWRKLVKPHVVTLDHVAAHYAVSLLFEDNPPASIQGRSVRCERFRRRSEGSTTIAAARADFREQATGERWTRSFFAAVTPGQRVQAYVCEEELPEHCFDTLMVDAAQGTSSCVLPPGRRFFLRDLRPDEREKVLTLVLNRRLNRWESRALDYLEETLPLVVQFRGLGLPLPSGLGEETSLVLAHALAHIADRFANRVPASLAEFRATLGRGRAAGVDCLPAIIEAPWDQGMARLLDELEKDFDEGLLRDLRLAVSLARDAGVVDWRTAAQTRFFRLWKKHQPSTDAAKEAASSLGIAV